MADAPKKPEHKSAPLKPEGEDKKKQAIKPAPKPTEHKGEHKEAKTGADKKVAEAAKRAEAKKPAGAKKGDKTEKAADVKIVDQPAEKKHVARAKANITADQKKSLQLRSQISDRRPWFRRTQWYEYKRLGTAWRKPMGMDSAMRRHFGYEQSVVKIGFGGPKSVRGLHPSGFREVYVDQIEQLKAIDVKTQAARISGTLGTRKLKLIYAEADKLGVRILNRRTLQ
jgi:large subunit ribosomal protein L32e